MSARPLVHFTCFGAEPAGAARAELVAGNAYDVERIEVVRGPGVPGIAAGMTLWRLESKGQPIHPTASLIGTTQHQVYTELATRRALADASLVRSGPIAVLIPIRKSPEWWALAQDERQAYFVQAAQAGHIALGQPYAGRIARRLYHSRYLPNSDWDFLTYFEFAKPDTGAFRDLLATLRDPTKNPEWGFVDREVEVWMTQKEAVSAA